MSSAFTMAEPVAVAVDQQARLDEDRKWPASDLTLAEGIPE